MSTQRPADVGDSAEPTLCACPPGPCLGWAFDAAACRVVESHANLDRERDEADQNGSMDRGEGMP